MQSARMGDIERIPRSAMSSMRRRSSTNYSHVSCDFTIPESPEKVKSTRRRNSSITGESSFLKASLHAGALDSRWFDDCCRELKSQLMLNPTDDIGSIEGDVGRDSDINDEGRSQRLNLFSAVINEALQYMESAYFILT